MTKKHFISLAETLRDDLQPELTPFMFEQVVGALAAWCHSQNSNFNEAIFRGYIAGTCGPSGGAVRRRAA